MGDVRDPERDQPLPKPGGLPVQAILIQAIADRRAFGKKKYGRVLETDNGRDPLVDLWEELLDGLSYLTQLRLERGDILPGMEGYAEAAQLDSVCPHCNHDKHWAGFCKKQSLGSLCACEKGPSRKSAVEALDALLPRQCMLCAHEPHVPGACRFRDGACSC